VSRKHLLLPADPLTSAKVAHLRYVTGEGPGITRRRRGKGFFYIGADSKPVRDETTLKRSHQSGRKELGRQFIGKDDEIVITWLEHHANIVPWQQLANETGVRLRVAPVDDNGQILLDGYTKLLGSKTKLVSFPQVSNALGTITPAKQIIEAAHAAGAKVLLDGAQSVSHMPVNVQDLNADWFVFSGHKIFAPTGIGVLYGKEALLNEAPPWQGGGNMITDVTFERSLYQPAPGRFEAGTGNIADAVGLGAALDYVNKIGRATQPVTISATAHTRSRLNQAFARAKPNFRYTSSATRAVTLR
jgi:selenocysteine lyase/cysteine desulfurase